VIRYLPGKDNDAVDGYVAWHYVSIVLGPAVHGTNHSLSGSD
jgi:hypothetical protein